VSWPAFAGLHPFAPEAQSAGYGRLVADLERWLAAITGFAGVSLQPNAGSQGEYAGLLVIRAWQRSRGEQQRNVCLIPTSAHGTNPASAVMAGMQVVPVACDEQGNIDRADLQAKAEQHSDRLAALMVTYPSTHGVFEQGIQEICALVHAHGGQVYLDGANLNAQVGLAKPGLYGADVCHLNLLPPGSSPGGTLRWCAHDRTGECRPLGQRQHPADQLDVHPFDGWGWPAPGLSRGAACGQLAGRAARTPLPGAVSRRWRPGGPRMHPRSAALEAQRRP